LSLIRVQIAIFPILFSGFLKVVSTLIGNTVLNGFFSKITGLIVILACNLAVFYEHLFLVHSYLSFFSDTLQDGMLLPAIAITSENLGFWGV
jgi:hypothetical protein